LFFVFGVTLPFILILKVIGLNGFKEITRFERHASFYYRLNPITKISFTFLVTIVAAVTIWWVGAVLTMGLLLFYLTLLNGLRKFVLGAYLAIATVIGTVQGIAPYLADSTLRAALGTFTPRIIWIWPSYFAIMGFQHSLSLQALFYALQISMRIAPVLLSALLLVMTSTPSGILRSLNRVGLPIPIIFSLIVAMRTIPRLFDAISLSISIQFMRGLGSRAGLLKVFYYIEAGFTSIIPVFIFMLRGAKNTAISADTRAFRAFSSRTYMTPSTFSGDDVKMFSVIVIMVGFAVAAITMGFGRTIPYVT
jgi:energy-coupling factor transport system permease protein